MCLINIMTFYFYDQVIKEFDEKYWPLYFSADVLIIYKFKDEYFLNNRKIECDGELLCSKFFLSSNGDQVVMTQKDFSLLQDNEKEYWNFFRESPKSDISKVMNENIYLGIWVENDVITNIRNLLINFPKVQLDNEELDIWKQPKSKTPHNIKDLYYVVSGSKTEWINEILTLDKNLIDGFQVGSLKKIAERLNCYNFSEKLSDEEMNRIDECLTAKEINKKHIEKIFNILNKRENGSINLLEKCLKAEHIDEMTIKKIIQPLRELKKYRSKIVAHNVKDFPNEDLRTNFKTLLEQCNDSLLELSNLIKDKKIFYFN